MISASESCIDYIGDTRYDKIIMIEYYSISPSSGYERFQTTGCLYTFRRDMVYFNRCVYRVRT